MKKTRVMIVDDHVIVQEGLKQLLELEEDIEVVEIAGSGFECIQSLEEKANPDIILMDIKMKDISGIEATKLICKKYPNIKVIMLTIYRRPIRHGRDQRRRQGLRHEGCKAR